MQWKIGWPFDHQLSPKYGCQKLLKYVNFFQVTIDNVGRCFWRISVHFKSYSAETDIVWGEILNGRLMASCARNIHTEVPKITITGYPFFKWQSITFGMFFSGHNVCAKFQLQTYPSSWDIVCQKTLQGYPVTHLAQSDTEKELICCRFNRLHYGLASPSICLSQKNNKKAYKTKICVAVPWGRNNWFANFQSKRSKVKAWGQG